MKKLSKPLKKLSNIGLICQHIVQTVHISDLVDGTLNELLKSMKHLSKPMKKLAKPLKKLAKPLKKLAKTFEKISENL